ncbi:MAG: hypothetical protein K6T66_13705 [Peptococcaceae bacterium]|nr:hypothetical protein [Peptococcaceae bacterium]
MIKIAIADDQVLLREMLSMVLSSDNEMEIVGLAGTGRRSLIFAARKNLTS